MSSPVSRRALGECNAIKNRGFGHCKLTFVSSLEASFGARHKAARDVSFGVERIGVSGLCSDTTFPPNNTPSGRFKLPTT